MNGRPDRQPLAVKRLTTGARWLPLLALLFLLLLSAACGGGSDAVGNGRGEEDRFKVVWRAKFPVAPRDIVEINWRVVSDERRIYFMAPLLRPVDDSTAPAGLRPGGVVRVKGPQPTAFLIVALDRRTGRTLWRRQWRDKVPSGESDFAFPDKGLLAVSLSDLKNGRRFLAVLDAARGGTRWEQPYSTLAVDLRPPLPIAVRDGVVYATGFNGGAEDRLAAVDLATARVLWSIPLGLSDCYGCEVAYLRGDRIVLHLPDGNAGERSLHVHDAHTGRLLWKRFCPIPNGEMVLSLGFSGFYAQSRQPSGKGTRVVTTVYDRGTGEPRASFTEVIEDRHLLDYQLIEVDGENQIAAVRWREGATHLDRRLADGEPVGSTRLWDGSVPFNWFIVDDGRYLLVSEGDGRRVALVDGRDGDLLGAKRLEGLESERAFLVRGGRLLLIRPSGDAEWEAVLYRP